MTIIELLIRDTGDLERQIREAAEQGKLSKRAGQILIEECIRMFVAVQTRNVLVTQAQEQAGQIALAAPAPLTRQ